MQQLLKRRTRFAPQAEVVEVQAYAEVYAFAPEALQLPRGRHHGADGMEADSHGDHLALLRVGLAAEEERETKAVVTR